MLNHFQFNEQTKELLPRIYMTSKSTNPFLQVLDKNLQEACVRVEARYYFEKAGCYGMAMALQEKFIFKDLKASLAIIPDKGHAVVLLENQSFDYTGFSPLTGTEQVLSANDFLKYANDKGHNNTKLYFDKDLALQAIAVALEMVTE